MLQYLRENKHVIMVAVTLFVLSMSSVFLFFGSNGELAGKDIKTDILQEPITVKSLQEKENTYRKLLNNQEDTVIVISVDGLVTFSSWNIENTLGYKQQDLNHQMLYSMIYPDDLPNFMSAFGKVLKNKKPVSNVGPYRLRDQSGAYRTHIGSFAPIVSHGNVDEIAIASKEISPL